MGRVRESIDVKGRQCWTLFDTGARNTYVVEDVAKLLTVVPVSNPRRTGLGGAERLLSQSAILEATISGCEIDTHAYVIGDLGFDETGKPIEVLFGALAMQQWGIRPIPDEERLDVTHYTKDFVEF